MSKPEDFPLITGHQQLTDNWSLTLPIEFRRRIEDGQLVIWRPNLTFWLDAFGNEDGKTIDERLIADRARISSNAANMIEGRTPNAAAIRYELAEPNDGGEVQNALFTLMHGAHAQIMMAAYFDTPEALELAKTISASLTYTGQPLTQH